MKLTPPRIGRTLAQLDGTVVDAGNPVALELKARFGDHTFFIAGPGLCTVEPTASQEEGPQMGRLVWLARWDNDSKTKLVPHEPVSSTTMVMLGQAA